MRGNRTTSASATRQSQAQAFGSHPNAPRGPEIKDKIRCRKVATLHHKGIYNPQPTKTPCATLPSSAQLIDKLEMEIVGLTPQPKNNDKIHYTAKIPPFPQIPKSNTHHLPRQCVPISSIYLISQLTYYIHTTKVQKICAPPMRVMRRPSLTTNLNSMGDSTVQR